MSQVPPASDRPLPTVERFLRTVLRSGLLDRPQLQEALRDVPRDQRDSSPALADHLVKKGKLTRFQANKLLRGTGRGLLLGSYQVLAPIGRGAMGTVYLARDGRNGELVALKLLPPSRAKASDRLLARFQREMELCQLVAHPHLAWTFETGQVHDVYFIAMEYIPGKSLYRLVTEEGPLPVPRAARLMAEVASGLEHAHNQGLIHRDLKPSNILITPHDHAKVLDLGLALLQGEEAEEAVVGGQGYIVGTMDYIAPEQTTDSSQVDRRADVYSLGCTLYFTLSGQPPFPGGTSREKIFRHRGETPTPLLTLKPDLPPAFVQMVEKMMAKNPDDRYPSAAAVEDELRSWAVDEAVQPLDRPEEASDTAEALQAHDTSTDFSLPDGAAGSQDDAVAELAQRPPSGDSLSLPAVGPDIWPDSRTSMLPWLLLGLGTIVTTVIFVLLVLRWLWWQDW
jgi:serine/threonine protein kinase